MSERSHEFDCPTRLGSAHCSCPGGRELFPDLSDRELADVEGYLNGSATSINANTVRRMLPEIRRRRSSDPALRVVGNNVGHGELLRTVYLTGNEMEALRRMALSATARINFGKTALAALAKIVGPISSHATTEGE